jgi:hypothetical protein
MEALQKKKNEDRNKAKAPEPAKIEKSVKLDSTKQEAESVDNKCQC